MSTPAPLASTVTRTNNCLNPVALTTTTGWSANAGTSGVTGSVAGVAVTGCPDAATAFQATWTTAATAGNPGGYYYASTTHAGADGGPWRGAAWARFSWACNAFGALYAYNSAGTNIGTHTMPTVAVAAGQWVRFASDGWTPPAGTDRLLFLVYRSTGGLPGVGDTFQMTACVIEPAVQVPTLDAYGVPPFFDGDSLNASWVGAAHASASTLLVIDQNPSLPVLEFAAWPGANPTLTGVPASARTILTDRARSFKIDRGRQYELAQDEAASGAVVLNNSDGQVMGGANGCTPITSAQLRARWNGVTYPVWTGQIRSWPQQDDTPSMAWAEAELTDSFEALANHPLASFVQEEIRSQTSPDAWYPMNEAQSSSSIGNLVPGGVAAPLVNFKLGGVPLQLGGTSVFPGTSDTVLTLANSTGAVNKASQYQMVGPQNPRSGYSLPFGGKPWGVGLFVRMTAGSSMVWSALDWNGELMAAVLVSVKDGVIAAYGRNGGIGGTLQTAGPYTTAMTTGCYIHAGHDGTQLFCEVYYCDSQQNLYSVNGTLVTAPTTGTSRWVGWGQGFRSDGIYMSSNADMQMAHGTIWTTTPPPSGDPGIIAIARAGLNAYAGRTSQAMAATVAALAGVSSIVGDPADGQPLGQLRDTSGSAALDAIRAVSLDYLGRVFMNNAGQLTWQSVHHAMGAPTEWTLGSQPGEQPYSGAPAFDFDPTYVYNDVQVQRPDNRGVDQQASSTKAVARVTDAASMAAYFQRVLQLDSNVAADADALAVAQYLLGRYRQPQTRVRTVKFNPSANPALWPFVLSAELGDTVTLNHRAIGRPTVTLTLSVQKISHELDAQAGTWTTSMELAPWSSDWALAAMHTTIAATVAAGVSSITINPLPDAATNPAEASIGAGTTITLSPGTANAETVTIASVASTPTAGAAGYTGITLGLAAPTGKAHTAGDVACDPLPSGVTDPTSWDAFSVLGSTTVLSI